MSVDGALIVGGWGVVGWCRKSCLGLKLHLFQTTLLTFTFTVNSHADIHFHIYVYLFQILCSMKSVVFIRIQVKDFYIQIWFECETPLLLFLIRNMVYRKKLFTEKSFFLQTMQKLLTYMLYTHDVTCTLSTRFFLYK